MSLFCSHPKPFILLTLFSRNRLQGFKLQGFNGCCLAIFGGVLFLIILHALLFCAASPVYAGTTDLGCGRDTNGDGIVNNLCLGDDQDFDGYTTAQGDCDDADWQIYPETLTSKGCGVGQYRSCRADGSGYGPCTNLSALSKSDIGMGVLNIYWVAPNGTTGTNGGTYANPWDYRCLSQSNGYVCSHTPQPGDAFIFKAGRYTTTYVTVEGWDGYVGQLFLAFRYGTSENPIYFIGDPTGTVTIVGQGTLGNAITPIDIYESGYIHIDGMTISDGYGSGIYVHASGLPEQVGLEFSRLKIYNIDGDGGPVNLRSCTKTNTLILL